MKQERQPMQTSAAPIRAARDAVAKTLLTLASTLALLLPHTAPAQTFTIDTSAASPLTGLWWNANESGWGATITQQSSIMFVTMFVYDTAGNPVWYTVSCTIAGASCSGDMLRFRGGAAPTAPWIAGSVNPIKVGSMTLNFTGNDAGAMNYTLDGLSASRQITRQIFGPLPVAAPALAGQWQGAIIETRSSCAAPQNNGGRATYGQYNIGMAGSGIGNIVIALAGVTGLQCSYSGDFTTNGARLSASGTLSCNDGKRGTWHSTSMIVLARAMSLELAVQLDTTETCTIAAVLGGSRQ